MALTWNWAWNYLSLRGYFELKKKKLFRLEDTGSIDCQYILAAPPLSSENGTSACYER